MPQLSISELDMSTFGSKELQGLDFVLLSQHS